MAAVAEAAEVAGASDLDNASPDQLTKAWGLVRKGYGMVIGKVGPNP